ncbi:MAG: MarR family transcriptional regulator [Gammaproteobacteria bacterium]|nr:MarR family transcriptional regulator [Gammaproteobacteria bacterium]NIP89498.1 MarR family transcriptional regulator [Gammaproteobacteria bacterium]NIR24332.1 MarR family transcriptional regulator [Gammaproteobacteria bacterium]NIS06001.1 MarR family transcriptional regulator [Gammaproteobacteria bacterium]NIU41239.1 MarR family transcriptional regulator [Gammaproteobacteria bacterium]
MLIVSYAIKISPMLRENLQRNFGFILHDVARLLRTTYDRRIRDLGLTRSQWWVLTHLYRKDGITQSELAETLELEKPSLGRLLDRLESNGWVRRAADPDDRRAKRVFLTDQVEEPMQVMRDIAAGVREDALSGLSADDRDRFVDTLLTIKSNLMAHVNGGTRGNGQGGR